MRDRRPCRPAQVSFSRSLSACPAKGKDQMREHALFAVNKKDTRQYDCRVSFLLTANRQEYWRRGRDLNPRKA